MLMFVGEDLDIVTVASRTPESPSSAPAVVKVVDHNDIVNYGYRTLAEVLATQPGFYISDQGMGSTPYMRGISNGILILYDGVPVPTGGTRNYYPLDYELSLNSVKRIEIIRGPGSVLWGADAFAGIVNIVPFTGKDLAQKRTGSSSSDSKNTSIVNGNSEFAAGSSNIFNGFADIGYSGKSMDAYLSVYGGQNRYNNGSLQDIDFWNPDKGTWLTGKNSAIDESEYKEFTANFTFNNTLSLSGRFSDFNKIYTQTLFDMPERGWVSEKTVPSNFIKANYATAWGGSHLNITSYYQDLSYEQMDAGTSIKEDMNIFYGEILWDSRIFRRGLLTAGISYRENHVKDAPVDKGFMPELLISEYRLYPQFTNRLINYRNELKSFFSQYRHPFTWGEFWAGFRFDDNSMYDEYAPSYTLGINIPINSRWRVKNAFGTGYRTPYSQQWRNEEILTRDEIATLNIQAEWNGGNGGTFSVTAYASHLSDNVQSDPFAGLTEPQDQDFTGLELSARKKIGEKFEGFCSLSKIFYFGDDYNLSGMEYSYFRPDGTSATTYDEWSEQYDPGADFIVNTGMNYHLYPQVIFSITASWTSPIPYSYKENSLTGEYSNPILVNSEIRFNNFFHDNISLLFGCKNILDGDFTYSGFYGPVKGNPLTAYTAVKFSF